MAKSGTAGGKVADPVLSFAVAAEWEAWLHANHAGGEGVWLRIAKKNAPSPSVSYAEALDAALCYGWIDAQKKSGDAHYWLQRFTPRRARSIWSKINREKAENLIRSGRMQAAGLGEIERAKGDGRWAAAYDSPATAEVPVDLKAAFDKHRRAADFFASLNKTNRYAILWRIQTAKRPETRARRIAQFVEMLARGEKLHP